MILVKTHQDGSIEYPYSIGKLREDNPEVSFSENVSISTLNSYNVFEVIPVPQGGNPYKIYTENQPVLIDSKWYQSWSESDMTQSEINQVNNKAWSDIRGERNKMLSDCDWTQLNDAPITQEKRVEWVQYRQALRDVTLQPDPFNVNWPIKPL